MAPTSSDDIYDRLERQAEKVKADAEAAQVGAERKWHEAVRAVVGELRRSASSLVGPCEDKLSRITIHRSSEKKGLFRSREVRWEEHLVGWLIHCRYTSRYHAGEPVDLTFWLFLLHDGRLLEGEAAGWHESWPKVVTNLGEVKYINDDEFIRKYLDGPRDTLRFESSVGHLFEAAGLEPPRFPTPPENVRARIERARDHHDTWGAWPEV